MYTSAMEFEMNRNTDTSDLLPHEIKSFWKAVEELTTEIVPYYLKHIITAAGYDRYTALKNFPDDMKLELELFARERIPILFSADLISTSVYLCNPEQFKLVPGHIQLLKSISQKLPENAKHFHKIRQKHAETISRMRSRSEARHSQILQTQAQPFSSNSLPINGTENMHDIRGENSINKRKHATVHGAEIDIKIRRWIASKKFTILGQQIDINVTGYRKASVECWLCSKKIALSSRTNKNGSWYWIISNFTKHLADHMAPRPKVTIVSYFNSDPEPLCEREVDHDSGNSHEILSQDANEFCTDDYDNGVTINEEKDEYFEEYLEHEEKTFNHSDLDSDINLQTLNRDSVERTKE
ncbi:uncharacterized protein LOC131440712 [Malaya genurostris]|uniref:uncharacterized protein LOC131440712 n=1 Tax=Malaya genurostris TaxID=325434 RepID=UPI0026F38681|nr:uncharacterized protein LOC131440712 [Malaya genurostris]